MTKCKHPKNRRGFVGEFDNTPGCLDCGRAIIKKVKKRKKVSIKSLRRDAETLRLIIKYSIAVDREEDNGKWFASVEKYPWRSGKTIHTAVRRAAFDGLPSLSVITVNAMRNLYSLFEPGKK